MYAFFSVSLLIAAIVSAASPPRPPALILPTELSSSSSSHTNYIRRQILPNNPHDCSLFLHDLFERIAPKSKHELTKDAHLQEWVQQLHENQERILHSIKEFQEIESMNMIEDNMEEENIYLEKKSQEIQRILKERGNNIERMNQAIAKQLEDLSLRSCLKIEEKLRILKVYENDMQPILNLSKHLREKINTNLETIAKSKLGWKKIFSVLYLEGKMLMNRQEMETELQFLYEEMEEMIETRNKNQPEMKDTSDIYHLNHAFDRFLDGVSSLFINSNFHSETALQYNFSKIKEMILNNRLPMLFQFFQLKHVIVSKENSLTKIKLNMKEEIKIMKEKINQIKDKNSEIQQQLVKIQHWYKRPTHPDKIEIETMLKLIAEHERLICQITVALDELRYGMYRSLMNSSMKEKEAQFAWIAEILEVVPDFIHMLLIDRNDINQSIKQLNTVWNLNLP